jgi:hypothetical protein
VVKQIATQKEQVEGGIVMATTATAFQYMAQ